MTCYIIDTECWVCESKCELAMIEEIATRLLKMGITNPTNEEIESIGRLIRADPEFDSGFKLNEALERKNEIRKVIYDRLSDMGQLSLF